VPKPIRIALSPLADPVVSAIFANAERAGRAAKSLINAVLEEDGIQIAEVISVTPQSHASPVAEKRASRVDVFVRTEQGELIIVEIQLSKDANILDRNLLAVSHQVMMKTEQGTKPSELSARIPRIIVINIVDDVVRADHPEAVQPIKFQYTKPPIETAYGRVSFYAVQLPLFERSELLRPVDCWMHALITAHREKLPLKDVIEMTPALQTFMQANEGFRQFAEQYNHAATDEETVSKYVDWLSGLLYEDGIRKAAREEANLATAQVALAEGLSPSTVAKIVGLPLEKVEALIKH